MKVLHIGPKNYPPAHGGVEKSIFDLIRLMDSVKSFVFVEWNQEESANVKVLPKGLVRQIISIYKFAVQEHIDVLHFHKEGFIPHSLFFAVFTQKKCVHSIRGCAWRIKRWSWPIRTAFYILDLFACLFIKRLVFVGKEDYRHFSKIFFWRKLNHIPNGVSTNAEIGVSDTSKCVYIGRISPEKNLLNLISMFYGSDKSLMIYGPFDKRDASYNKTVLKEIENQHNIKYGGIVSHTEITSVLAKYNTFCNISFSEGMPVSVLEAASVGLNLILSDIPQHKDLKFPDVDYVDPFKTKFSRAFHNISSSNKAHVEKYFALDTTVNNYLSLYNK